MKNVLFFIVLLLLLNFNLPAQVSEVNYSVEFNKDTELFDCYLHIVSGSTRSDKHSDRIQFNSQISLVSHTGVDVQIVERYAPLINNIDNNGTEPNGWQIFNRLISPDEAPGLNFYSISPKLAPTSHYNDLEAGDKLKLFSLKSEPTDTCTFKLRMFDNVEDSIIGTSNGDYSNGFSVGGISQLYNGNMDDTFMGGTAIDLDIGPNDYCQNSSVKISFNNLEWRSTNTDVAIFDEDILNLINPGVFYFYGLDKTTKCHTNLSDQQKVEGAVMVSFTGSDEIIVGETTTVSPSTGGMWSSSNISVATISNGGIVTGISNGVTELTFIDDMAGCSSEGLQLTVNMASNLEELEHDISIYPNPSTGLFFIKGYNPSLSVKIYGIDSKELSLEIKDNYIDLSPYSDGIYIVKLENKFKTLTRRIIKSTD